jgi:predicted alpha/beta superfamily hydrolase
MQAEPQTIPGLSGSLEAYLDFPSQQVEPRRVDVWLPPGFPAPAGQRFPVLYAHDGQNLFDPRLANFHMAWRLDSALASLIAAGKIPPPVVVAVWSTPRRWPEYTPQKPFSRLPPAEQAAYLAEFGPPASDAYLRFLVAELKPFVDARYPTLPGRETTFIMGSSMGGLVSLYALLEYPQTFAGAGCLSTHWPAAGGSLAAYLENHPPDPRRQRLYFDHGTLGLDAGYGRYQERVDRLLEGAGYQPGESLLSLKFPGAAHNEDAWRQRAHLPLEFLLGK